MKKIIATLTLAVGVNLFASDVVAVVNGHNITKEQINNFLQQLSPGQSITYDKIPENFKKQVLKQFIQREVLIDAADKSGIKNTKEFKDKLKLLEDNLAVEMFLNKKEKSYKISDSEIKRFYNTNRDMYFKQNEVHARHILVKSKEEAEKIINILNHTPKDKLSVEFIKLAKKYSIGPSAKNGGDLGYFTKNKMVKPFADAAFSLGVNEYTKQPVKTQFGWHVIYVEDKKTGYKPLEEVKPQIEAYLKKQKLNEYVKDLVDNAKIEYK